VAFADSWSRLTAGLGGEKPVSETSRRAFLERYLSKEHRDHAAEGCPLVGIAAELARSTKRASRVTARHLERVIATLASHEGGAGRARAIAEVSSAVGALLLARLLRGEPLSDEILETMVRPRR
jgi:TetR/AcrR family transcriptional repressor of nem operon